jgi:hypothetical protein
LLLDLARAVSPKLQIEDEQDEDEQAVDVTAFCEQVAIGLAGKTPEMIACTLVALATILQHFKGTVQSVFWACIYLRGWVGG